MHLVDGAGLILVYVVLIDLGYAPLFCLTILGLFYALYVGFRFLLLRNKKSHPTYGFEFVL